MDKLHLIELLIRFMLISGVEELNKTDYQSFNKYLISEYSSTLYIKPDIKNKMPTFKLRSHGYNIELKKVNEENQKSKTKELWVVKIFNRHNDWSDTYFMISMTASLLSKRSSEYNKFTFKDLEKESDDFYQKCINLLPRCISALEPYAYDEQYKDTPLFNKIAIADGKGGYRVNIYEE